jgi:inorganic pyrophosphatase
VRGKTGKSKQPAGCHSTERQTLKPVVPITAIDKTLIAEVTNFFIFYNEAQGKKFKSLGFGSRQRALDLVQEARKRARKKGK